MKELNDLVEVATRANIAGQGTPGMADFRVTASPDNILAIAEAFRALEQENILLKQGCKNNPLVHEVADWKERSEAAEAKLDELEKQEPVAYITEQNLKSLRKGLHDCFVKRKPVMVRPVSLFTRPTPAFSLAELVPEKWTLKEALKFVEGYTPPSEEEAVLFAVNSFRAAILRNIEEQSQ